MGGWLVGFNTPWVQTPNMGGAVKRAHCVVTKELLAEIKALPEDLCRPTLLECSLLHGTLQIPKDITVESTYEFAEDKTYGTLTVFVVGEGLPEWTECFEGERSKRVVFEVEHSLMAVKEIPNGSLQR